MTVLAPGEAGAIPAFARKYRMSCTTCHAPVPRLKAFGEEFAGNAFRLEGQEPAREFLDTGDDLLTLHRALPLAVRFDAYASYTDADDGDFADLETPYGIKLLTGGNLSEHIGFYFYFYMNERGEVAGIEDAYLHFNNLFGVEFDAMVGQFQASDPLFKRELRLTFEDYECYKFRVGDSPTNLTYDRGVMMTYGTGFGTDVVVEVVNGNGKGEAVDGLFDEDDWKNVLLRLSQGVGPVRAGGFGYLCKSVRGTGGGNVDNEHYYWGVDGTVDAGEKFQVNAQYLQRHDDNPFFFSVSPVGIDTKALMVEAILAPRGELGREFVTFLVNWIDSDIAGLDYESYTLSFSYLLKRNLRLLAEGTYEAEDERTRLVGGFVSAF
ncbi:MAG: hypothetical protein JW876_10060 [Candidatus Krumholzibacteriota bacterium]|nr:hypothetical protein [Candidatus Krumholzibacteriota bacterium]